MCSKKKEPLNKEPQVSQEVAETVQKIKELQPSAVHELLATLSDYYLIDIRYSSSFKSGQKRDK